ncbi:MAG TPA: hypothetical protein VKD90_06535 [Gemmataceae bacterium]|nr:hypothetical protein [Gemmataceae bacterium]
MPIAISCPHCDWKGRVKDELAGKKGKCPTCGELVPIPSKSGPPPVPGGKKPAAVDDDPDVVDDADIVDDDEAPTPAAKPRVKPKSASMSQALGSVNHDRKRSNDDDDDGRPRARRRADDDDEDERPRSRRRTDDDDEDERPRSRRRVDDDDDDERPARSRRAVDDDDDENRRPARRRKFTESRKRRKPKESINAKKATAFICGVLGLVLGGIWLAILLATGGFRIYPIIIMIIGLIGIFQAITGIGLKDSSDDDDDDDDDDYDDD